MSVRATRLCLLAEVEDHLAVGWLGWLLCWASGRFSVFFCFLFFIYLPLF